MPRLDYHGYAVRPEDDDHSGNDGFYAEIVNHALRRFHAPLVVKPCRHIGVEHQDDGSCNCVCCPATFPNFDAWKYRPEGSKAKIDTPKWAEGRAR